MKTFVVQVGRASVREIGGPEDLEHYLTDLLTDDGAQPEVAQSTARQTVRCLMRGGRYAPDDKVTELANASPVRVRVKEMAT